MRKPYASTPEDPLAELLLRTQFRSTVLCKSRFSAPWGVVIPAHHRDSAIFHLVLHGACCTQPVGEEVNWLSAGDITLFPHGTEHLVASGPTVAAITLEDLIRRGGFDERGVLHAGGGGDVSSVICGAIHFEDGLSNPLLRALPNVVTLQGRARGRWFNLIQQFLADELESARPGVDAIVTRLAETLFVEALREFFASPQGAEASLTAALQDPRIGQALLVIHREPERAWSLHELATHVNMSRTAFAVRFNELVGEPTLRYVGRCRINKAIGLLRSTDAALVEIAERVGYGSEIAFSRAFKRFVGTSPAAFRANTFVARRLSKRRQDGVAGQSRP